VYPNRSSYDVVIKFKLYLPYKEFLKNYINIYCEGRLATLLHIGTHKFQRLLCVFLSTTSNFFGRSMC